MLCRVRQVQFVDQEFDEKELMTQKQASDVLNLSVRGVHSAIERGLLTVVESPAAHARQGRRLVLRKEGMALRARRR